MDMNELKKAIEEKIAKDVNTGPLYQSCFKVAVDSGFILGLKFVLDLIEKHYGNE